MLVNYLEIHLKHLLKKEAIYLRRLEERYNKMPQGKLAVRKKNSYLCYYLVNNGNERGIGRNKELINALCEKISLESEIAIVNYNLATLKKALLTIGCFFKKLEEKNSTSNSRITSLIAEGLLSEPNLMFRWSKVSFESNSGWSDDLKYKTPGGTIVRTKSEYFIAIFLEKYHIPYRYEAKLAINGEIFYPDFTLYKPDGTFIVWGHLGLYGDPNYDQRTLKKLISYRAAGYVEHTNLICTYEGDIAAEERLLEILNRYYYC
ncbi:MAG: hypothetical protein GX663_02255 [Clostridiales bacterium]|nr:hypothetical protein [Clostridiales bacterium]